MKTKINRHVGLVLLVVAFVALLSGCGEDKKNGASGVSGNGNGANGGSSSGLVQGTWGGVPPTVSNGITFNLVIRIDANSITNTAVCTLGGHSITASATARAEINPTTIRTLEHAEYTSTENGLNCTASVDVGEVNYSVSGNSLTLTKNGQNMVLNRIN